MHFLLNVASLRKRRPPPDRCRARGARPARGHINGVLNPEAKADVQHSGGRKLATLAKRRSLGLMGPHTLAIYEAGIDAERDG
jgi:hypothetical protein